MLRDVFRKVAGKVSPPVKRLPVMVDAPPDKLFWLENGVSLKNVKELRVALRHMSDEQYRYYTVPRGNDFSRWVRTVLGQEGIAKKLEGAKTRSAAVKVLE